MSPERLLPPDTTMGAVTLWVSDLDTMLAFSRDAGGIGVISERSSAVNLASNQVAAVILEHRSEMKYASSGQAGLLHTALIFPTRGATASPLRLVR